MVERKIGLVGSMRIVCRDKDGNIKWIREVTDEEATDEEVKQS